MTPEDQKWLEGLDVAFHPEPDKRTSAEKLRDQIFPEHRTAPEPAKPRGPLSHDELGRLVRIIESRAVIVELFAYGMFAGIGANLYEHSSYPGVPPKRVFFFIERNLPDPIGEVPPKSPGCLSDHHWKFFTGLANTPDNVRWVKENGLEPVRHRDHYEY